MARTPVESFLQNQHPKIAATMDAMFGGQKHDRDEDQLADLTD
jgi:hypothetical protein